MTTRRGRVACRFPRKDQSSAVDFFPFWNEVFSARTGQLKIWGIAFGEGFVFGVTCLSDLCHLCELCIYLASIHHEASCPFKLMESQTRTTRDMPRYGLWRKRAESLIVEQKRQLCAESRRLGISLAFALDELQGLGLREKSAEIWRTTRCNDTMIHDKWAQSGNQATRGRSQSDQKYIKHKKLAHGIPWGLSGLSDPSGLYLEKAHATQWRRHEGSEITHPGFAVKIRERDEETWLLKLLKSANVCIGYTGLPHFQGWLLWTK